MIAEPRESRPIPNVPLPPVRHFALTWEIPDDFGGMTRVMLRRSRAFAELAGATVEILTFDAGRDYDAVRARLRGSGILTAGVQIRNLWDDLSAIIDFDDATLRFSHRSALNIAAHPGPSVLHGANRAGRTHTRYGDDGTTVVQVDHLRPDGSLLLTDQRDTTHRGRLGGRTVVLFNQNGDQVRVWKKIWDLYSFWLDRVIGSAEAVAIIDSKVVARFAATYRRPNVTTMHLIHNSHLATEKRPFSPLRPSRATVLRQLHNFDAAIVLTPRQRDDLQALLGPMPNLAAIPNSVTLPPASTSHARREPGTGIMLASLESAKRVDHAIRAIAAAKPHVPDLALEIYGQGTQYDPLQELINSAQASEFVHLRGFDPAARDQFQSASFLLLTSRYEGFPLVLLEAMAAGTIPIAYDIPYGPSDIIEHGVTGFLVEAENEEQLAETIANLATTDPSTLDQMRQNARARVEQYTDQTITALWADEMAAAVARKAAPQPRFEIRSSGGRVLVGEDGSLRATVSFTVRPPWVALETTLISFAAPSSTRELRATAAVRKHALRRGRYSATALLPADRAHWLGAPDSVALSALVTAQGTTRST